MILLWRRERTLTIGCVIVFLSVYLPNGAFGEWYGGQASPARLLTPVVPVLAVGIASMLDAGSARTWRLFSLLAIPSFLHGYLMMPLPSFTRYGDSVTQHNFFIALLERYAHLDLTLLFPELPLFGLGNVANHHRSLPAFHHGYLYACDTLQCHSPSNDCAIL